MKIKKTKKILICFINMPVWFLSKLIKPKNDIWIFGAWFGEKYCDNSKYLFEYVSKNCPNIKAIWLSENDKTIELIRSKGYISYGTYTIKGYWYTLFAKYGFVSTGYDDINFFPTANMHMINLWHGIPLKKIMKNDDITRSLNNRIYYKLAKIFFPFIHNYYSTIATSEEVSKMYQSAFENLTHRVDIIGQTRCDSLYLLEIKSPFTNQLQKIKSDGNKIGIYMPTHRKEGKINFSKLLIDELENLNKKIKEFNAVLLIKLHYYHQNDINNLKKEYSNIIFIKDEDIEQDIYSILPITEFLITDYSSIYFDYLHLNKPILFFPFDKDDYLKTDRAMYFDYDEITPGEKAYNWDELYDKLKNIVFGIDNYKEQRQKIHNIFNKYQDGKNCERIVEWIKSLDK